MKIRYDGCSDSPFFNSSKSTINASMVRFNLCFKHFFQPEVYLCPGTACCTYNVLHIAYYDK